MKGRYGVNKYILIAFAVMAAAYWHLSGGASFTPAERPEADRLTTRVLPLEETLRESAPSQAGQTLEIAPAPTPDLAALPPQDDSGPKAPLPRSFTETLGVPAEEPLVLEPVSTAAAPVDAPAETPAPQADLRLISGDSVNMRAGPGTNFSVLSKLARGTEVTVLDTDASGWQQIRVGESSLTGWVSGSFLAFPR